MSYDGDRQARIRGLERQPFGLNGMPCRRHRFAVNADARNVSQPGIGAETSVATGL